MIVIHPYKASWPREFAQIRNHLASVVGARSKHIAHIGSTAVPGLAAKDIIDVQIGVDELTSDMVSILAAADYEFVAKHSSDHVPAGDVDSAERWTKLYFRGRPGLRPCHIHIRDRSNPNHRYALLFRDYLRAHSGARLTVELVKRQLARLHGDDVDAYYDLKDPVYDLVWHAANDWATHSGWRHEAATEA